MQYLYLENEIKLCHKDIEVGYIYFEEKENILSLNDVYVYPGYRRNGYGKDLCDEFIKFAQKKSAKIETDGWFFKELYL